MPRVTKRRRFPDSSGIVSWVRTEVQIDAQEILDGKIEDFLPTERDFNILEAALRYNYLTSTQIQLLCPFGDVRSGRRRLLRLHTIGLLDRAGFAYRMGGNSKRVGEYVYALSQTGFDMLRESGTRLAREWNGDWHPRSQGESRKLSLLHELGRNDVCLAMMGVAERRGRPIVSWLGPREAFHRVPPPTPGAQGQRIEPDSALILDTGRPLLIEYERSGRPDRFHEKLLNMRRYVSGEAWRERYLQRPWVVYAIPSGKGTQDRAYGTFGALAKQAKIGSAMRYLLLDDLSWTTGDWQATDSNGDLVDFWKTVLE